MAKLAIVVHTRDVCLGILLLNFEPERGIIAATRKTAMLRKNKSSSIKGLSY
jgi:hypothetical protein